MKAPRPSFRCGQTLVEVLVVIVILVILAGVFVPSGPRAKAKPDRIACVNNLKNLGLALRTFSSDHGDKWPMDLSVTNRGTREWLTDGSQLWRHWLSLSNGLATPKMLLCPADKERQAAKPLTWAQITDNSHLSYFLGLDAREDNPQSILAGDRNLTTNGAPVGPGRLPLTTNMLLGWTRAIHGDSGNLLLGDGSVQQTTSGRFRETWHEAHTSSGFSTNVWLVP